MNCGRIYGQVVSCQRSLVPAFALFRQCWVQTTFSGHHLRVRQLRFQCHRQYSQFTRLRRGFFFCSAGVSRACAKQVEFVVAQQIRRAQQAATFYLKLCGSAALFKIVLHTVRRLLNFIRLQLWCRTQALIMSASTFPVFCWSEERIPEQELLRYINELEAVACLRLHTCVPKPNSAVTYDSRKSNIVCADHVHDDHLEDPWELFINGDSLLVWRREVPNHRGEGLYEYKVYGAYHDITALDFLAVHVDCEFRKEWDSSAVALQLLESEPESNSEVVYWEMQWPRMMSNRDYVYKRRYLVNKECNVIVLLNQNTEHQSAPVKPGKQRVSEYWSIIVIKPSSELDKPGLEFSMTYFDNPGLVFPSAFASWATATGFPDYLNKLHEATLLYAERRNKKEAIQKEIEAAAREEERKRQEEEERQKQSQKQDPQSSQRKLSPEAWEVILGGGPVLNSATATEKSRDASEKLHTLINKLVLMIS